MPASVVRLKWSNGEIGELVFGADGEPMSAASCALPSAAHVELQCMVEVGDGELLANVVLQTMKIVVGERRIAHVSILYSGRGRPSEIQSLVRALPPCECVSIDGGQYSVGVAATLEALCASAVHWRLLRRIQLRQCGPSFTSLDVLRMAPSLEAIEVTGANNLRAPWENQGSFRGFDVLQTIAIDDTARFASYESWISATRVGERRPALIIGNVNLPQPQRIELGRHVRFRSDTFAFAREHWLPLTPTYIDFLTATTQRVPKFVLPERCSAPELNAVLREQSSIVELDCRACAHLTECSPTEWLPAESGLGGSTETEIKLLLPSLRRLGGTGAEVDSACDEFAQRLERLFGGRNGQTTVKIEGEVAARLYAWQWLFAAKNSRVSLVLSCTGAVRSPVCDGCLEIDLGQPFDAAFCRLLAQQGQDACFARFIRVVEGFAASQIALLRALLAAWPNLKLHLEVKCHGGAEFALVDFVVAFENRVSISGELAAQFEELDFERQEYERAARWAEDGGAR